MITCMLKLIVCLFWGAKSHTVFVRVTKLVYLIPHTEILNWSRVDCGIQLFSEYNSNFILKMLIVVMERFSLYLKTAHKTFYFNCFGRNKGYLVTFRPVKPLCFVLHAQNSINHRGKTKPHLYIQTARWVHLLAYIAHEKWAECTENKHFWSYPAETVFIAYKSPKHLHKPVCKSCFFQFL